MGIFSEDQMEIYYERGQDYGHSGDPLLFISGTGGDLRNKPNQFDSPLAKVFELIAYDQRGLGQTSKPDGDYTMADYADDAAALLDYLNLERVPVVGVSFGGMVGQEFVLRHQIEFLNSCWLAPPRADRGAPLIRFMRLKS